MSDHALLTLAQTGQYDDLESEWIAALDTPQPDLEPMVAALDVVFKAKESARAETLAWTALSELREKLTPNQVLAAARDFLIRAPGSNDLRNEVVGLYREVYKDNPHLENALNLSGLASGAPVRKGLRTLDLCLHLQRGAYILNRFDEQAAEIIDLDEDTMQVTVKSGMKRSQLGPDQIAAEYDIVDADDFRILKQLHPERIAELGQNDPLALITAMVKSHQNRLSSDELKAMLSPRFIPRDQWSKWWTKARNAAKKSNNLLMDGKSPIIFRYDAKGRSLEDEFLPALKKMHAAQEFFTLLQDYLRQCKGIKHPPSAEFLNTFAEQVSARINQQVRHSPAEALANGLVYENLTDVPGYSPPELNGVVERIFAESEDPTSLFTSLPKTSLWTQALNHLKRAVPDDWPAHFVRLLPVTPSDVLDTLTMELASADQMEAAKVFVRAAIDCPADHVDAIIWLWKGPANAKELSPPPRSDLLFKIFAALDTIKLSDTAIGADARDAKIKIRTALGLKKYEYFNEAIEHIDQSMAIALKRMIERADGLGTSVGPDMILILTRKFPDMSKSTGPTTPPWQLQDVIFCTPRGIEKKQAELSELVNVKIKENAIAIGAAAEHGDLSENSEYKFALEERDLLQARMRQMQSELAQARVMSPEDVSTDRVSIGTTVVLRPEDEAEGMKLTIFGPWEGNLEKGVYNYHAPICQQILGHRVGESLRAQIGNDERRFTVESIEAAPFD
jgi:transcription elongation factor GreA